MALEAGLGYRVVVAHATDEDRSREPASRLLQLAWRPAAGAGAGAGRWEGIPPAALAPTLVTGAYVTLYPVRARPVGRFVPARYRPRPARAWERGGRGAGKAGMSGEGGGGEKG